MTLLTSVASAKRSAQTNLPTPVASNEAIGTNKRADADRRVPARAGAEWSAQTTLPTPRASSAAVGNKKTRQAEFA